MLVRRLCVWAVGVVLCRRQEPILLAISRYHASTIRTARYEWTERRAWWRWFLCGGFASASCRFFDDGAARTAGFWRECVRETYGRLLAPRVRDDGDGRHYLRLESR